MFSNVRSVLSQCNTGPRLLLLLYDIEVMLKTIKDALSMFYGPIKHESLTNHKDKQASVSSDSPAWL